jgi:hypothetical protein
MGQDVRVSRLAQSGRSSTLMIWASILIAEPSAAQRTEFRDKNGNLLGYTQYEGNRTVLRDQSGNPHGYWRQEGNWLVHRDAAGNLLDRQQTRRLDFVLPERRKAVTSGLDGRAWIVPRTSGKLLGRPDNAVHGAAYPACIGRGTWCARDSVVVEGLGGQGVRGAVHVCNNG